MARMSFRLILMALGLLATGWVIAQGVGSGSGGSAAGADESVGAVYAFSMFFRSDDPFGQAVILLLVLMSVLSLAWTMLLAFGSRRRVLLPEEVHGEVETLIAEQRFGEVRDLVEADASYLSALIRGAIREAPNGYEAMERGMEEAGDVEIAKLLRQTEYLNVLGNVSPMIGLFGTVYGMIRAFEQLVSSGGSPDPAQLAGGISTALVTTLWGLIVAIPALTAYALIRNRLDALTSEGFVLVEGLLRPFKPTGSLGGGSGPRPVPQPR